MITFRYKARDRAGKSVAGFMEAVNREALTKKLEQMGYMATSVAESSPVSQFVFSWNILSRIGHDDMYLFNVQLSNLINAGIPLVPSLGIVIKEVKNRRLKEVISDVSRNVEAGEGFSKSLERYPQVFSSLFIAMIRAGEASGKLDTILARFAEFSEKQNDLRQKVRGALLYPLILMMMGFLVTCYIVTFIIPQFVAIFIKTGVPLPLPTKVLYQASLWLRQYWWGFLSGILGLAVLFQMFSKTQKGKFILDRIKLSAPIFGSLYRKVIISRFSRTLGMLVESAVPILMSLDIVKDIAGNQIFSEVVANVRRSVERGERIGESLKRSGEFTSDAIQMITVGEESGTLGDMLQKVSDFYDHGVDYTIKKLTTLLEPLLLTVMGGMVGFIMASMLLPMFDMLKTIRHG